MNPLRMICDACCSYTDVVSVIFHITHFSSDRLTWPFVYFTKLIERWGCHAVKQMYLISLSWNKRVSNWFTSFFPFFFFFLTFFWNLATWARKIQQKQEASLQTQSHRHCRKNSCCPLPWECSANGSHSPCCQHVSMVTKKNTGWETSFLFLCT